MKVIAVTGGIGSGKSTVTNEFARLGARTISADSVAHENMARGGCASTAVCRSCAEARRTLIGRVFDLIVVNAPLCDETGEKFACDVAAEPLSSVILIVRSEIYEEMSARVEEFGVFTVARPLNRQLFWSVLKLAGAARAKAGRLHHETEQLKIKLEDVKTIDRAKCALIQYLSMTEKQAHHFIEKQAMDRCVTRRSVAEEILAE